MTVLPVWFAPWKYLDQEDVWRGLIGQVIVACLTKEADVRTLYEDMKDFAAFLGRSFVSLLSGLKFTAASATRSRRSSTELGSRDSRSTPTPLSIRRTPTPTGCERALNRSVERYARSQNERIVIFIDNLKRPLPPNLAQGS